MASPADMSFVLLRSLSDHGFVFCRLLGLLILIPGLKTPSLGWQLRGLLLVTLAAIITPNVSLDSKTMLEGRVIRQVSVEEQTLLVPEIESRVSSNTKAIEEHQPRSFVAWMHLAIAELCLGLLLGAGANLVLQSFRMAGSLIEQQIGLSIESSGSQDGEEAATGTGELFFWLGGVLFLIAGGHLLCISTLLNTFRDFPVAFGEIDSAWGEVCTKLMHQSLSLALQLAAPIVATQLLVTTVIAHAGNTAPQFNSFGISTPIRILTACVVLSLTLSGLSERILDVLPVMISSCRPEFI